MGPLKIDARVCARLFFKAAVNERCYPFVLYSCRSFFTVPLIFMFFFDCRPTPRQVSLPADSPVAASVLIPAGDFVSDGFSGLGSSTSASSSTATLPASKQRMASSMNRLITIYVGNGKPRCRIRLIYEISCVFTQMPAEIVPSRWTSCRPEAAATTSTQM